MKTSERARILRTVPAILAVLILIAAAATGNAAAQTGPAAPMNPAMSPVLPETTGNAVSQPDGRSFDMTTQAQSGSGAVPNLELSSASPGELTIAWDAPDPAPSDYRVIWAKQELDFPSYKDANEANRGNEYPGGTETSLTLTGLTGGETFKARARARYTSGGRNNGPWSGPWTDTVTARVQETRRQRPPDSRQTPPTTA